MKEDASQKPILGHIAEELAENPALERFVVYDTELDYDTGQWVQTDTPLSIDFIQLLLAQTAQLNARVAELEALVLGDVA